MAEALTQDDVVSFLSGSSAYGRCDIPVKRIETHAAIVFLAGERAYKVKRAVALPYLDFSTPELRHQALLREFDVNRNFAPDLYLEVIPITRAAGGAGFKLGGEGVPVDWVLVMQRFPDGSLLADLTEAEGLSPSLLEELSAAVEHSHRTAPVQRHNGATDRLQAVVENVGKAIAEAGEVLDAKEADTVTRFLRKEFERLRPLLEAREQGGFVRRCHGDLHLRNIILWHGTPKLFDALEFDETLATIDVLYDLAFLLMDLLSRDLVREANCVLNHYLEAATPCEIEGLAALPFFISLRAAVRAMVGLHRLRLMFGMERASQAEEAQRYLDLACKTAAEHEARFVAIGGLSGTGKTTIARLVAPALPPVPGAVHLRTDVERKVMLGVARHARLDPAAYSPDLRHEVYRRLLKKAEIALDAGYSVIFDAVFPDEESRRLAAEVAQRQGRRFSGFWLEAPAGQLEERVARRLDDASDADIAVVRQQLRDVKPPQGWTKVDVSGAAAKAAEAILRKLGLPARTMSRLKSSPQTN